MLTFLQKSMEKHKLSFSYFRLSTFIITFVPNSEFVKTMSRHSKPLPLLQNVTIEAVAAEGKCLFHADSLVVFVPFCVPGDVADVQLTRKKHSYAEGEVVRIVKPSDKRIEPVCRHFGICGGCKWQNMPYEEQLAFKQKQVEDQLTRIGKLELPEFMPIKGSVKTLEYRNKLDFGCCNKKWYTKEQLQALPKGEGLTEPGIGFHITGAFDKILPIEKCWLMDNLHNDIRNAIYDYATSHGLTFFDLRQQAGLLRDIIIRCSNSQEWMVLVQFGPSVPPSSTIQEATGETSPKQLRKEALEKEIREQNCFDRPSAMALLQYVAEKFPQITSLMWVYNPKCNDTFGDLSVELFKGTDHIFLLMEDLKFKVGPKSFYQTNTEQALHLYNVARDFAGLTGNELVYDLYTGTGTIANFVARMARKVIGIEYVDDAIADAKINSEINGISNTLFYAGDMKDILTDDFIAAHGRPDVIITDPPRAGMHPDVIKVIINAHPRRIVYVSCNPATQARDLQLLDADYKVTQVQPVDMFPHTPHVENVVLLEAR